MSATRTKTPIRFRVVTKDAALADTEWIEAESAAKAAAQLHGRLVQSCPGWARVFRAHGLPDIQLFWR